MIQIVKVRVTEGKYKLDDRWRIEYGEPVHEEPDPETVDYLTKMLTDEITRTRND